MLQQGQNFKHKFESVSVRDKVLRLDIIDYVCNKSLGADVKKVYLCQQQTTLDSHV